LKQEFTSNVHDEKLNQFHCNRYDHAQVQAASSKSAQRSRFEAQSKKYSSLSIKVDYFKNFIVKED